MIKCLYYIMSIITSYLFAIYYIYFLDTIYTESKCKKKTITICGLGLAIFYFASSWGIYAGLKLIYMPFIYFALAFVLYEGTIKSKILMSLFFHILNYSTQLALEIPFILNNIPSGISDFFHAISLLLRSVMMYLILVLIRKYVRTQGNFANKFYKKMISILISIWLLYIIAMLVLLYYIKMQLPLSDLERGLLTEIDLILMFLNIFVFFILVKLQEYYEKIRTYETEMQKSSYSAFYYQKMEDINSENQQYIHNIEHYLKTIAGLAADDNNREIVKIIEDLELHALHIANKIYCGNKILNAIINEKMGMAKENNIDFQVHVATINLTFIDDVDLIGLLGNLLDNALEASRRCQAERTMVLNVYTPSNNRFLVFCVENSCFEPPSIKGGKYITIKKNKERHGIGMEYIKSIIKKYDGFMHTKYHANKYCITVTLPNKVIDDLQE